MESLTSWLVTQQGLAAETASAVAAALGFLVVLVASAVAYLIARIVLLRLVKAAASKTDTTWDDALVGERLFSRLSHLIPAVIIQATTPVVFADYPQITTVLHTATFVYLALVGMTVFNAALNGAEKIYGTFEISHRFSIRTVIQIVKLIVYFLGSVAILAILLGKSPLIFLSGLGAFTAVLLLVFKDPILGFVAGIQLSVNNMVRAGDWIEMPRHGADGDVIDVSLTTVKVQNFDKTISTIPTYALVSESFRNWRGMSESSGRRIKRAVNLDLNSISFCDSEMLGRFKRIQFISDYVERKLVEAGRHNRENRVDESLLINGRHLTNVGTFRAYLEAYLRNHPSIHQGMTLLVRQLDPTEQGLPIEIYVFSVEQDWGAYEAIQADIFDHVLAVVPLFDLRVFQRPAGADLRALAAQAGSGLAS